MNPQHSRILWAALAALLSAAPASALAQGIIYIYDQQSATETNDQEGATGIQPNQPMGQSFTPVLPSIGFIRLGLGDANENNGFGATLYVNLRTNSITGPILSSTDPVPLPDGFGRGSNGYVNFFFSRPVALVPGTVYYFQPVVQSGDTWEIASYSYGYPGGTAYFQGRGSGDLSDLWFREGVVAPEPSPALLVVIGGCLLFRLRPRKRMGSRLRLVVRSDP